MRRVLLLSLLLLPLVCAAASESAALAYLQRVQLASGAPAVSAAVCVRGELQFSGGVGLADLQTGMEQTGRTVHSIGSLSKVISVVAVMQLVEEGKVSLDAQLQTYAPWFPRKPSPITVRQILTHTSGIRHYKDGEFGPAEVLSFRHYDTFEESTRFWRDDPLLFTPGTHYLYSSFAASLMQAVVESTSGKPFEDFLAERVWQPARMTATQLDMPARIVPGRGRGYFHNPATGRLENAKDEDVSYKYAGGGMLSTDEDLCRFGHALNSGRLLSEKSLRELYRPQLPQDIPFTPDEEARRRAANGGAAPVSMGAKQALIFFLGNGPDGRAYTTHTGEVKRTTSVLRNYYQDDVVIALYVSTQGFDKTITASAMQTLAELYLPERRPAPKK